MQILDKAINKLLGSRALYNKFPNNMEKERNIKYNWSKVAKSTRDVYKVVLFGDSFLGDKYNEK